MPLEDRLQWLIIGLAIGYILGRFSKDLSEIKKELSELDERLTEHDQRGFFKPSMNAVALLIVVALSFWASISSQIADHKGDHALHRLDNLTNCNQVFLGVTLDALGERSTFSADSTQKNIDLQESQHGFFTLLLHQPPPNADVSLLAAQEYNSNLGKYINVSKKSLKKLQENPIPSVQQFADCVKQAQ